jgi:hypothetical protein
MNIKYYLARSKKQIENINEELKILRIERDKIKSKIENLECIRDCLKAGIKIKEENNEK